MSQGILLAFRDNFALMKTFDAVPSPFFSAVAELRIHTPHVWRSYSVPTLVQILNPLAKSCRVHPRRLTSSDSLILILIVPPPLPPPLPFFLSSFHALLNHFSWSNQNGSVHATSIELNFLPSTSPFLNVIRLKAVRTCNTSYPPAQYLNYSNILRMERSRVKHPMKL